MEERAATIDREAHAARAHEVPDRVYFYVWAALVTLTGITVGVHYTDLSHMAVITALLIATVKCSLVVLYFMHIRFERPIFAVMILATIATYATFIILTFADYYYR
jgi:cytochrome c oxidase subunit 4